MNQKGFIAQIVLFIVGAIILVVLGYTFIARPYKVSGENIVFPPYEIGKLSFAEKVTYLFKKPAVGDRVIFSPLDPYSSYIGIITKEDIQNGVTVYTIRSTGKGQPWTVSADKISGKIYYPTLDQNEVNKIVESLNTPSVTPTPTSISTITPKTDETANWKTYTSEKYSFKYPNSWNILKTTKFGIRLGPRGDETIILDCVSGSLPKIKDIPINKDQMGGIIKYASEFNINGLHSIKEVIASPSVGSSGDTFSYEFDIELANSSDSFHCGFFGSMDKIENGDYAGGLNALVTINQILSTFKFLDQNTETMTIKGKIVDFNDQPFINPDITIKSVDSNDKCNSDSEGNFTCSVQLIKGKTYGIYFNNTQNNSTFVMQYFGGDPGQILDIGTRKVPR